MSTEIITTVPVVDPASWIDSSGHDYASPSKLDLCALCPGYPNLARATERMSLGSSEAAQRGKDLHAYTVDVLTGKTTYEALATVLTVEDLEQLKWCVERTREIIARFPTGIVQYEVQIDLRSLGISGGPHGCRIDCLIVVPGVGLVVIDWKYGRMWVTPPEWNSQLQGYSWGASNQFGGNVEAIVLQPQSPEGRDYMQCVFTTEELVGHAERIRAIVAATRKPGAPLVRGEHCRKKFCSCYSFCPLYKASPLEIPIGVDIPKHITLLDPAGRGELYSTVLAAKSIVANFEETCKTLAVEHGVEFSGYEVGPGKNSYACSNTEKFQSELLPFVEAKGLTIDAVMTKPIPSMPATKSEVEKILGKGKAVTEIIKSLYTVIPGKPTLKKSKT